MKSHAKDYLLELSNNSATEYWLKRLIHVAITCNGDISDALSDEIYAELTFGGKRHISPAAIEGMWERTVTVNGFSKAFSMTGWRLGFACGPREIMDQITKIHQFAIMCAPTTSQYAAIEALRGNRLNIR